MKITYTALMKVKTLVERPKTPVAAVLLWNRSSPLFRVSFLTLTLTAEQSLLIPDCIAQTAQKTSNRKAVFLTKMKVMCEEYKLDATQSLEEVGRYLSVQFKSYHRSPAGRFVKLSSRSELDKGIEVLTTPENDDIIEEVAKAFGKRHVSTQRVHSSRIHFGL